MWPLSRTDVRSVWGHRFVWTDQHVSADDLHHLLFSYDKLASDALDRLDEISPPSSKGWKCAHSSGPGKRDLYELLKEHSGQDEKLAELWNEVNTVPEWVDWDQVKRGQQVVFQFSSQIMLGLLYTSLVAGMGAFRVVETLGKTGGFGIQVAKRRLLETLQHFIDVCDDLDSIKPGGKGFVSSVRVRLLHAAVRRRILQLEAEKPGYFDVNSLGVPINDLHCMGTISVYSTTIINRALPRQGIFLTRQQTADYLAFWRWVGYVMGTPTDWMENPELAKAMMESIEASEIVPSANGGILANNILTAETNVPPLHAPREYLTAVAYHLIGPELCQALDIDRPRVKHRMMVWFQCFMLMCMGYSYPLWPAKWKYNAEQRYKRLVHHMITNQHTGGLSDIKFDFQYVPEVGKSTELGAYKKSIGNLKSEGKKHWLTLVVVGLTLGTLFLVRPNILTPSLDFATSTLLPKPAQNLSFWTY